MKVNIYYGGRGLVDDPTIFVIDRMQKVLEELNNGNNELVAYVVINNDLDGDELKDSICDYVNAHKPEYMVPSYVVKLDAIPLNVNGKIDKNLGLELFIMTL